MNVFNALNALLPSAPQQKPACPVQATRGCGTVSANPLPTNTPTDLSTFSNEVNSPEGIVNPAMMQMLFEMRLQFDLQGVDFAKRGQGDAGQALQSLQTAYQDAKQKQIPLSQELESSVLQALGINQGSESGNAGGGCGNCGGISGQTPSSIGAGQSRGDGINNGSSGGFIDGPNRGASNGGSGGSISTSGQGSDNLPEANQSGDDQKFLNSAINQNPNSFGNLVTSWRQGAEGNCSTVAVVKAAMDCYDNQVFDDVKRTKNGYNIVMQDGYKMTLTDAELASAKKASKFKGEEGEAKSYATFLYGAAAKRNALTGKMTMSQSLNDLNNGESFRNPAKFLGLSQQMVKVDPRTLNGRDSVVAASKKHAIFVNKNSGAGHTADRWGKGISYNGTDGAGRKIESAYAFKPRSRTA